MVVSVFGTISIVLSASEVNDTANPVVVDSIVTDSLTSTGCSPFSWRSHLLLLTMQVFISALNPAPLWQVPAGAPPKDSPLLAETGEGMNVFIPLGDRGLGGWDCSGVPLPGFPVSRSAGVSFRPASFRSSVHGTSVLCYVDDRGSLHMVGFSGNEITGWPVDLGSSPVTGVSALDLDSDGEREIAVGTTDGGVHLVDEDGFPLPGWPLSPGGRLEWQPTQVTLGSGEGAGMICALSSASLAVFDISGTLLPGWPVNTGFSVTSAPVSADLDADGFSDIILSTGDRRLHALNLRGSRLQGWPYILDSRPVRGTLAVGIVDCASGRLQVSLATENSLVYLIDYDATLAGTWRWPVPVDGKPTCPLMLSTWDQNTVLTCTDNGSVLSWDSDGGLLEERCFIHPEGVLFAPAAGDVDGNGITDLVVIGASGVMAAYPLGAGRSGPWPMILADASNSGSYGLGALPMLNMAQMSGELSGDINVSFCASGGLLTGLEVAFSTDAGFSWTITRNYSETSGGLVWRSRDDLGSADEPDVRLRITPRCASGPGIAGVSSIFRVDNNTPPRLYLTPPELLEGGLYRINYAVEDDESDVLSIQGQFSTDGGLTWLQARLTGSTLEIDPWLYGEPVEWNSSEAWGEDAEPGEIAFRLRARDVDEGGWSVIEGFGTDSSSAHSGQILAPDFEVTGRVRLGARLPGIEDILGQVSYEFTLDDGATWRRATVTAPGEFDPRFYDSEIVWESSVDAPFVDTRTARFRAVPDGAGTLPVPSSAFHLDNNEAPGVEIESPGPRSVHRGTVPVDLRLGDAEGDSLILGVQYRLLGTEPWHAATGVMDNGPASPDRYRTVVEWNSSADLPGAEEVEIEFRAFAADKDTTFSSIVSPVALINTELPSVIRASATPDPENGRVTVQYELSHPGTGAVDMKTSLSLDGGLTWRPATVDGTMSVGATSGYSGILDWFSRVDVDDVPARVLLRLTPSTAGRAGVPWIIELQIDR